MILVVGSTGLLGGEICRQLIEKEHSVKALIRKTSAPEKIAQLEQLGCVLAEGDLKNPNSIARACQGIEAIISTASSTLGRQEGDSIQSVDLEGQIGLVDAAAAAGVKKFVFISFVDAPEYQNSLNQAKRAVEKRLQESGMDYTSLQASFFMEVWLSAALGFDFANRTARIYGSGEAKHDWISFIDVAKFAVASLDHPFVSNKTIPLGGPQALSILEIIAIFEQLSGKPFSTENVPVEALQAQREGASNPLEKAFASLMLSLAEGASMDLEAIHKAFALPLISVNDYAQRVLL